MTSKALKLKELIEISKKVGLDKSAWFLNGLQKLSVRWNETLYRKLLSRCLYSSNLGLMLNTTFPVPTTKDELKAVDGPYKIGRLAYTSIDFGLYPLQLQMHGIVGGGSGYGKSSLMKILAQQLIAEDKIRVWIIDPKEGGDYRFLIRRFDQVLILRPHVLKLNPFSPIVNVPTDTLREAISEVTADSFGVFDASEGLISLHVQRCFEEVDHPCFFDFIASLQSETAKIGGRKQGYLDTLETRLMKTTISLGKIIDCRIDYFSELYDKHVIFEIGELSGAAQRILVPWIIMKLVLYKIKNPTPVLSHLLIFDEAQAQIWSKTLELRGRQSYMGILATQCRAYGLGIICLAQNPASKLMSEIIANSCIKICFHLGSGVEINEMSHHMGLTPEQTDIMYHLDIGEAVCRVGLGYMEPMLLEIYHFRDNPMSNAELEEVMKGRWEKLTSLAVPAGSKSKPGPKKPEFKKDVKATRSQDIRLSPEELTYLRVLAAHPWRLITEVYAILNDKNIMGIESMSQSKSVKTRQLLLKKRYIESFAVLGTGKSGRPQCDILTEKGAKLIGKRAYKPRGGNLHGFWCWRIGGYFRKIGKVKLGDTLSGNECDVDVTMKDKRLGVEIVISSLVVENLRKHIASGYYDEILILCLDEQVKKKIENQIASLEFKSSIRTSLLKDYFISLS